MIGYEFLHELLELLVTYSAVLLELMGALIVVYNGITAFINYCRKKDGIKLKLSEGLSFGLGLKLGAEILRTVVIRDMSEIYLIASIVVLRACITLLIHWEIKNEKLEAKYHQ